MKHKLTNYKNASPQKQRWKKTKETWQGPAGYAGRPATDAKPKLIVLGAEKVFEGHNNCFVILGRDREGAFGGKGGEGATSAACVDVVVGLGGSQDIEDGGSYYPSFFEDSARLYVSECSDVDTYFGIVKGTQRKSSNNKSCIVNKADHVRLIARDHIKIVTGAAALGEGKETTSRGGNTTQYIGGIDLIAGNYDALQPLVKGENLKKLLQMILDELRKLSSRIFENQTMISNVASYTLSHMHPSPGIPSPTLIPSLLYELMQSYAKLNTIPNVVSNFASLSVNYLDEMHDDYINSKYVHTT